MTNQKAKCTRRKLSSTLAAAKDVEEEIVRQAEASGYPADAVFAIKLSLEEALTNAMKHGNRMDPSKQICVEYQINSENAVIVVEDQGAGFDLRAVPDPTAEENIERPSGRGIMLMRAFMSQVDYEGAGNRVRLVKWKDARNGQQAT